jgi:hypothetical protein
MPKIFTRPNQVPIAITTPKMMTVCGILSSSSSLINQFMCVLFNDPL